MNNTMKKAISLLLAAILCVGVMPAAAMAEEDVPAETELSEAVPSAGSEVPERLPEAEPEETPETPSGEELPAGMPEDTPDEEPSAEAPAPETEDPALEGVTVTDEQTAVVDTASVDEDEDLWPDSDELFAMYANEVLGIDSGIAMFSLGDVGSRLTGTDRRIYNKLKPFIADVAAGRCASAVCTVEHNELGIAQATFTRAELGVSNITYVVNGVRYLTEESKAAANAALARQMRYDTKLILDTLLADCPFDLYWFDKIRTGAITVNQVSSYSGNSEELTITTKLEISFLVTKTYAAGGVSGTSNMNTAIPARVNTAKATAQAIVARYAPAADIDKLTAYKNEICDMVSYNYDAASPSYSGGYGDPWQLIWVFDNDPSTNVVCEGYAKAFQYLCDLTHFNSSGIRCWSVTGNMAGGTGAGGHMWNVVCMEDGKYYLVDVTNCDSGTAGFPDKLFLKGCASGSVNSGYRYAINGSYGLTFTYDSYARETFGDKILTMSATDYANAPVFTENGVVYAVRNGRLVVTGYTSELSAAVTLGVNIDGKNVNGMALYSIAEGAFRDCVVLQSVEIPAGVAFVRESAFAGCTNLRTVEFLGPAPDIADNAFSGCSGVTAFYRRSAGGWTGMGGYGGSVTWKARESRVLEDAKTGVTLTNPSGWAESARLTVSPGNAAPNVFSVGCADGNYLKTRAYDITLTGGSSSGSVTVSIPVPLGFLPGVCKVYYADGRGNTQNMNARVEGGMLVFSTTHFSTYVVAAEMPQTRARGDANGDGTAGAADVIMMVQHTVGLLMMDEHEAAAADMNGDNKVDLADALALARQTLAA